MIAQGLGCGLMKISRVTACCDQADFALALPQRQRRGLMLTRQGVPCSIEISATAKRPMVQALVIRWLVDRGVVKMEVPAASDNGSRSWSAR